MSMSASHQFSGHPIDRNSPVVRALRRTELFNSHESTDLVSLVASESSWISISRRREILPERDDMVVVMASGSARIFARTGDRQLTLSYVDIGSLIFEERILPTPGRVVRHAVALENVEAVAIPASALREIAQSSVAVAAALLRYTNELTATFERRLISLLSRSVEGRVAEFILEMAADYGVPDSRGVLVAQRFTHLDIANYIGSTRETVTLVLGELKRAGIIELDARRLVIVDRERLYRKALE